MIEGSASTVIDLPAAEVFTAIADITRMGEWSPECVSGRWVPPATGPEVGATFEGDNAMRVGPVTLKTWTTTSEVTRCAPGEVFEFATAGCWSPDPFSGDSAGVTPPQDRPRSTQLGTYCPPFWT